MLKPFSREEALKMLESDRAALRGFNLHKADLCRTNLHEADLHEANLCWADLHEADLRGADLDYACWPLWCGGLHVKIDKRIACQLAYHFCCQDCDDPEYIAARNAILTFANQFHWAGECGKLEPIEGSKQEDGR